MLQEEIFLLENSLKNFILREVENRGDARASLIKYRGLSFNLASEGTERCFKVRIAAFEAFFRVSDGLKIRGSLCGDEKYVIKWYQNGNNRHILQNLSADNLSINTLNQVDDLIRRENE